MGLIEMELRTDRLTFLALLILIFTFSAPGLLAQEGADPGDATALAEEAYRLVRLGDLEQAVEKYRVALEVDPELYGARFQLARVLASSERYAEARAEFTILVATYPENSAARRGEITALLLMNQWESAKRKLQEGLTALPRDGQLAHLLARLLATAPVDSARDGQLALQLALKVYEIKRLPETTETVAMAYAETGDFARALEFQNQLIAELQREGDETRLAGARERLASFEQGQAWRAASPAEVVMSTEPPQKPGAG